MAAVPTRVTRRPSKRATAPYSEFQSMRILPMRIRRRTSRFDPSAYTSLQPPPKSEFQLDVEYTEAKQFSKWLPKWIGKQQRIWVTNPQNECADAQLAVAASDRLRQVACISDAPIDIDFDERVLRADSEAEAEQRALVDIRGRLASNYSNMMPTGLSRTREATVSEPAFETVINSEVRSLPERPGLYMVKSRILYPWALKMLDAENKDGFCNDLPTVPRKWRILKIGTPGHIAILLWNPTSNTAEYFDAGGSDAPTVLKLFDLFSDLESIVQANNTFLQQEDAYCTTWIYYYAMARLVDGIPMDDIVNALHQRSAIDRYKIVRATWDRLLYGL